MKTVQKQLVYRLYGLLLLSILSFSILPVKLLHQHDGLRPNAVQHDESNGFQQYDGAYCALCLHQFIHHYLPSQLFIEKEVSTSFFVYFFADQILFSSPNGLPQLRGPPFST